MSDETTMTPPVDWQPGDELKAGRRMQAGMLDKAKAALTTFAELVKWAAYDDAEPNEPDQPESEATKAIDLVTIGPAVKALGAGRIGGYLVMFGDPANTDLTGDYFTADTDFDLEDGIGKSTVLYHHGQDATLKRRKLGRAALRTDEVGVWIEAQLQLRDDYESAIYGLAEAGKMGWSSGTAPHLVEREAQANGASKITRWPLGLDASVTPVPAEPRIRTMPLKAYMEQATPYVKALLPQDAQLATSADATKGTPSPQAETATKPIGNGDYEMTPEEIQALIAQTSEATIKAYEAKLAAEPAINPAGVLTQPAEVKSKPEGFKSLGEQLQAVMRAAQSGGSIDRRLLDIKAATGLNETIGSDGGFLVQQDFANTLWRLTYDTGQIAARCRRIQISAGSNGLRMNALDETSRATGSRWGGVRGYWLEEAGTKTASRPKFKTMDMKLHKLAALCYATDELLQDATALESIITQAFAEEFAWLLDNAILYGTGVGQPLGILTSGAAVSVTKENLQVADTIVWQNIVNMWGRLYGPSKQRAVWLVNQSVGSQLYSMSMAVGTGGVPVYMPATGLSGQPYSTLFGRPVIEIEQADQLGDSGDIWLVDLSQYLLIEKGGVQTDRSIHVAFTTDETVFRFVMRVDGQPLWSSVLTPADGSSSTVSPFVVLADRA